MTIAIDKILNKVNEGLLHYTVEYVGGDDHVPIICEDGEYRVRAGYAVCNKHTGVREHTTTLLPGAIFQSQHLDATLEGLLNPQEVEYPSLEDVTMDDTLAN